MVLELTESLQLKGVVKIRVTLDSRGHPSAFTSICTYREHMRVRWRSRCSLVPGGDLPLEFRTFDYVRAWLPIRREQCAKVDSRKSRGGSQLC
jgi:hypothetical protein